MIIHKQGDPYRLHAQVVEDNLPVNISEWTIRSQIRYDGELLADVEVIKTDPENGEYLLYVDSRQTNNWTPRFYEQDIKYSVNNDEAFTTETFPVQIVRRQTERDF